MSAVDLGQLSLQTKGTFFKGDPGPKGDSVELQVSPTHIQYKYQSQTTWTDLIPLSLLRGPAGPSAVGSKWLTGNGIPTNDIGSLDDMYLSSGLGTIGNVYTKTASGWTLVTTLTISQVTNNVTEVTEVTEVTNPPYSLPTASTTVLGGVKIGANLTIDAGGVLSAPEPSSGGGGTSPIESVVSTAAIVIQSLAPVTLATIPLAAASAYLVRFVGCLNDNAITDDLSVCVAGIDKREMSLRVGYRDNTGSFVVKNITEGGSSNGIVLNGSAISGPSNLLTLEGLILTGGPTNLTVQAFNTTNEYAYRQFTKGVGLSVQLLGSVPI